MHIQEIFDRDRLTFSFEFFPPKDEDSAQFNAMVEDLSTLDPSFVSVTYGAGGKARRKTHETVVRLKQDNKLEPVAHLTLVCHSADEVREILTNYAMESIGNLMILGGDPPRDMPNHDRSKDAFRFAAQLVGFVKNFNETGVHPHKNGFGIGVAGFPEGHPGTPNRLKEMQYLKAKVDAGADYVCTQLFFDNAEFYDFCERCELDGIKVPIVAGIMPVVSKGNMERMAELSGGTRYPAKLLKAIRACANNTEVKEVGIQWAIEQCRDLLKNGVAGIHFYTLNQSDATRVVMRRLGIHSR